MRVISWNLKNIGQGKLAVQFVPLVRAQVGNTVLDYMVRVVLGRAPWNVLVGGAADVFVVIELKTGGHLKGHAVSQNCTTVTAAIVEAVNVAANAAGIAANYHYSSVTPVISGRHETVGIIYNDIVFANNTHGQALKDDQLRYLNPRTPMLGALTLRADNTTYNVIGIHAPPPTAGPDRFERPILFCQRLSSIDAVQQSTKLAPETTLVMGDFNCDEGDTYEAMASHVSGFEELTGTYDYESPMPNDTLTSVRRRIDSGQRPPDNYLSGAYDNIFSYFENRPAVDEVALDLIGNTPVIGLQMCFNGYASVSDHIPVMLTW